MQQEQKKKKTKIKRNIDGMPVCGGGVCYFSHYLQQQIGAKWPAIKDCLYEAGYNMQQVNEYRNGLLDDFYGTCREAGVEGSI